jgi:site-specific DNA recombinase
MIAKNEKSKPIRCAIYTRKSHEEGLEQEFNSLDAQREACEAYIASQKHEGWKALATHYDDGGFTGGNMERPGLKALLADIEAGGVDVVMVYKVDRLSRSLMDFSKLVALFEEHDVAFVSVTQHFDTTSSMGRLTLNILLSFAQFERELCGERIRDKIASAKRKGKYVGGRPLLGYDVDHEKMRLLVNETEAKLVRHIFDRFCRLGSCMLVARELNEQGHRMKAWVTKKGKPMGGGMWKKTDVHHLLTNRRYIGEVVHKGQSYPGEHEAIVDRKVWDRVQGILAENRTSRANQTRKTTAAILKGILRCECCDAAMAPTYTTRRGKRYHYYVCHKAAKKGYDTCEVRSVPAGQIEQAVFTYLREIFADPAMVARTFRATRAQATGQRRSLTRQKIALEKRLTELRKGIGRLVRAAGDTDDGPLADALRKLNGEYTEIEAQVQQIEAQIDQQEDVPTERDVAEALRTVEPLWAELFPAEKERIVRLLVETVSVRPDGLTIRLRPTGLVALAAEVAPQEAEEPERQEATT